MRINDVLDGFDSDGSTLPSIIDEWNVEGVFEAGEGHDLSLFLYPNKRWSAYLRYIADLNCLRVEWWKIWILALGLGAYELTPLFLKRVIRARLTNRPLV